MRVREVSKGRHIEKDDKTRSVRGIGLITPREMRIKTFKDRGKVGADWETCSRRVGRSGTTR